MVSAADGQCFLEVTIEGPSATARWYDLWGAAVALNTVCIKRGYEGISVGEGMVLAK